jgi:hypothetical protein
MPRGEQVTVPAGAPVPALAPGDDAPVWHPLRADQVRQYADLTQIVLLAAVAEIRKAVRRRTASGQKETR